MFLNFDIIVPDIKGSGTYSQFTEIRQKIGNFQKLLLQYWQLMNRKI